MVAGVVKVVADILTALIKVSAIVDVGIICGVACVSSIRRGRSSGDILN